MMLKVRKIFTAAIAAYAFQITGTQANDMLVFNQEGFQAALASNAPVLVETYSTGCPVCWVQEPTVREIVQKPEFAAFQVFVIDVNGHPEMMHFVGAQTRSTLIVFKKWGVQSALHAPMISRRSSERRFRTDGGAQRQ